MAQLMYRPYNLGVVQGPRPASRRRVVAVVRRVGLVFCCMFGLWRQDVGVVGGRAAHVEAPADGGISIHVDGLPLYELRRIM